MRLAAYNVENLFDRAKVMNLPKWSDGREVLEQFANANKVLSKITYTQSDKARLADLLIALGLERSDQGPYVLLRRNRGKLLRRPKTGGLEILAEGRADWAGSLELIEEPIDEEAMRNTARVVRDVGADVLGIIEAEHRPGLCTFSETLLRSVDGQSYRHIMLIDGNDSRGIDVGLMTRAGYPIERVCSHVDDQLPDGARVFSRDCPEFTVMTPSGNTILVLVNHLKSKGYGGKAASDARRAAQALRVAEIYRSRREAGTDLIAILGDFNDTPDSATLRGLLVDTDLTDAFQHDSFDDGGYEGTYGLSNAGNKIDYVLLSPALLETMTAGAVFRKGMWPGTKPVRWEAYPEVARPEDAASDHAAIWVDLDV